MLTLYHISRTYRGHERLPSILLCCFAFGSGSPQVTDSCAKRASALTRLLTHSGLRTWSKQCVPLHVFYTSSCSYIPHGSFPFDIEEGPCLCPSTLKMKLQKFACDSSTNVLLTRNCVLAFPFATVSYTECRQRNVSM